MCGRSIWKDVFHLKELVRSVSPDDGEPKALGTFSKCRLQDGALQLRWISGEARHLPSRLFCCRDDSGGQRRVIGKW